MEQEKKKWKAMQFMRKYGYYMLACVLVVAIAVTLSIASLGSTDANIDDDEETGGTTITFVSPMLNATIIKDFSIEDLLENQTLGRWETHDGIDLISEDGIVRAVLAGTVTKIEDDYELGIIITVTHEDGFVSKYASLKPETSVREGDRVAKGEKLGMIGSTSGDELSDGDHLHFLLFKDGDVVDPNLYIDFELK